MTTAQALADTFDLRRLSDAFYDDPFPTYRALRESEPVRRMPDGSIFLTRYADVVAVYKDPKTFSSDKHEEFAPKYGHDSALFEHHTTSLVFNDPPLHTRVRRLIAGARRRATSRRWKTAWCAWSMRCSMRCRHARERAKRST